MIFGMGARAAKPYLLGLSLLLFTGCATTAARGRPPCQDHMFLSSAGTCVPKTWFCSPALYGAGPEDGCDCNCGAPDPDCFPGAQSFWCYGLGMARRVQACTLCD